VGIGCPKADLDRVAAGIKDYGAGPRVACTGLAGGPSGFAVGCFHPGGGVAVRYVLAVLLLLNQAVEDDITELTAEEAAVVAQFEGPLFLNGLATLSDEAAKGLAQHSGDLSLDGLTALSAEAAEGLGQHSGDLYLDGLTTLSAEAAKGLGQHKGYLYLNSLTTLSDEAAKALQANPKIHLPKNFCR